MKVEIPIKGTWRDVTIFTPKKINRQNADAELKKLCTKYLPGKTQNQEVRYVQLRIAVFTRVWIRFWSSHSLVKVVRYDLEVAR